VKNFLKLLHIIQLLCKAGKFIEMRFKFDPLSSVILSVAKNL